MLVNTGNSHNTLNGSADTLIQSTKEVNYVGSANAVLLSGADNLYRYLAHRI